MYSGVDTLSQYLETCFVLTAKGLRARRITGDALCATKEVPRNESNKTDFLGI